MIFGMGNIWIIHKKCNVSFYSKNLIFMTTFSLSKFLDMMSGEILVQKTKEN